MVLIKDDKKVCLSRIISRKINTGVSGFIDDDFEYDEFYDNKIVKSDYNRDDYDKIEEEVYKKFNVPDILWVIGWYLIYEIIKE